MLSLQRESVRLFRQAQEARQRSEQPVEPERKQAEEALRKKAEAARQQTAKALNDSKAAADAERKEVARLLQAAAEQWEATRHLLCGMELSHLAPSLGEAPATSRCHTDYRAELSHCVEVAREAAARVEELLQELLVF
ncbi:MAG: hypothetical protein ACUVS7_19175 [Bryobacteraceae bacterium]